MRDIRNMSIWKKEPAQMPEDGYLSVNIAELNLSVRAFNCLKRAGCNTIHDVVSLLDEDGHGLKAIRNLGARSEAEILENIRSCQDTYANARKHMVEDRAPRLVIPGQRVRCKKIEELHLSQRARDSLKSSGIEIVDDLYKPIHKKEPGWYAVRELFERISRSENSGSE